MEALGKASPRRPREHSARQRRRQQRAELLDAGFEKLGHDHGLARLRSGLGRDAECRLDRDLIAATRLAQHRSFEKPLLDSGSLEIVSFDFECCIQ